MSTKSYLLYCEICGFKRLTDGTDAKDLVEVKTSPMITNIPTLDTLTFKTIPAKFKKQKKRFKCPKCGRVVFPRKLDEPKSNNTIGYQTGDTGPEVQGSTPTGT
jgi:predicted RNA-binding Zn-ribbon protein involved in translation (DUF1610 family)